MAQLFSALSLGILYGLGPCTIFCAPILIPLIMAIARTGKEGVIQVFSFGFGRILSYIFLGAISGYSGYLLTNLVSQKIIGIFIVLLGTFILFRYFFFSSKFETSQSCPRLLFRGRELSFISGVIIGLLPCPPLLALLGLAVLERSFLIGAGMGFFFGMGSLITPLIIFGFLAGKFANLKEFKNLIPIVSGLFLIIFGLVKIFY